MSVSELDLLDWKRRVFGLYADVRGASDPQAAWKAWTSERDALFANHPQSPIPQSSRSAFKGLSYFGYDPEARVAGEVEQVEPEVLAIGTSGEAPYAFRRIGQVHFGLQETELSLDIFWLENYGGGLFLPFRDETAGSETYGAGRYLFDTVKGADLGTTQEGKLILDFNFAYNPSCAYDPQWVCPLAPPANRLDLAIRAGEKVPA
jgi:uncharacterized protein